MDAALIDAALFHPMLSTCQTPDPNATPSRNPRPHMTHPIRIAFLASAAKAADAWKVFGVTGEQVPIMGIDDTANKAKYLMAATKPLTKSRVTAFLKSFIEGKLTPIGDNAPSMHGAEL